jgi:hypothetical protein
LTMSSLFWPNVERRKRTVSKCALDCIWHDSSLIFPQQHYTQLLYTKNEPGTQIITRTSAAWDTTVYLKSDRGTQLVKPDIKNSVTKLEEQNIKVLQHCYLLFFLTLNTFLVNSQQYNITLCMDIGICGVCNRNNLWYRSVNCVFTPGSIFALTVVDLYMWRRILMYTSGE